MRIAIVNDAAMAVEGLRRAICSVSDYRLAWVARDGAEAVERCKQDTPDLILMDLIMPLMDGVEATRQIMTQSPCPILVVTATVEAHCAKVFDALGAGALDVVQTPTVGAGELRGAAGLRFKIESIRRLVADSNSSRPPGQSELAATNQESVLNPSLVVIGASAGGPAALATILGGLPRDLPAATVIIQHIDKDFSSSMAGWLNERSTIPVRIARHGDRPLRNTALFAGTNDHLVLQKSQTLAYILGPAEYYYRPSIDLFFESVARHWEGHVIAVLLTGMGRDGAKGLKVLRDQGALTIAQAPAGCAVYGMPRAAVELNAAVEVIALDEIARTVISSLHHTV